MKTAVRRTIVLLLGLTTANAQLATIHRTQSLGWWQALGQDGTSTAQHQTGGYSGSPEVFIEIDDSPAVASTNLKDIGPFALSLLRFRLMRTTIVHPGTIPAQACGALEPARSQSSSPTLAAQNRTGNEPHLYFVSGRFELSGEDKQQTPTVTFHYSVKRCAASQSDLLIEPRDVTFVADNAVDELDGIAETIAFKIRKEIPRLPVKVASCVLSGKLNPSESKAQRLLVLVRKAIVDQLNQSGDLTVNEQAEHVINCTIVSQKARRFLFVKPGMDVLEATISVKAPLSDDPYPDPDAVLANETIFSDESAANKFAEATALKALDTLRFVLSAERLGLKGSLDRLQSTAFLKQGKELLCIGGACSQTNEGKKGALQALTTAHKLDPSSAEILRYLAQAQNASRLYVQAQVSLEEAMSKLSPGQKESPLEAEIHTLQGDANWQLALSHDSRGSYSTASEQYRKALEIYKTLRAKSLIDPKEEVQAYGKYASALTMSNEYPKAIDSLLEGIQRNEGAKNLHEQAQTFIRRLGAPELEKAGKAHCSSDDSPRNECALFYVQLAAKLTEAQTSDGSATILDLAKKALAFDPDYPKIRAEALAYATMVALESDRPLADAYLKQAEVLPREMLSPEVRDWLVRLRTVYWLREGSFETAYALAKAALRESAHTADATLLAAEVALAWGQRLTSDPAKSRSARELFEESAKLSMPLVEARYSSADALLIQANHGQQKDNESRDLFLRILDRNPADDSASHIALWVCTEMLEDFGCSFRVAERSATAGFRLRPTALQLEFVEAAMLNGSDNQAAEWLKIVDEERHLDLRLKAVRDFYALWLSLDQKNSEQARKEFMNWRHAVTTLRSEKVDVSWSFTGAKKIWSAKSLPMGAVVLDMIKAFEDEAASLPEFPSSA